MSRSKTPFGPIAHTNIGMPAVVRPPAITRERLVRFAKSGARLYASIGAPNAAALCEAYLSLSAEVEHLRRQLESITEWRAEPTRRGDTTDLAATAVRTGTFSASKLAAVRR